MPNQPCMYFYIDKETQKKIKEAARKSQLSASAWLRLAALEKLRRDRGKEEKIRG